MFKITQFAHKAAKVSASHQRCLSTSAVRLLDQKWREEHGLPENPNAYGPLTTLPDYTYLDGRQTPMGANLKRRMKRQQEIAAKIVEYNNELAFAKERYARLQAEEVANKQKIIASKLKPKGYKMLEKK